MKVAIVSSSSGRNIEDMGGNFYYIYIPLTPIEKDLLAPHILNPCWRIEVAK